jgi:hypothetical protein
MNVDFNVNQQTGGLSYSSSAVGLWDLGIWDGSNWGSDLAMNANWQGITGIGFCGALRFNSASSKLQIQWASTDVVYQLGWAGI